jgi:uncharacterized membrane protein YphA (DoxX/SURF4 family)
MAARAKSETIDLPESFGIAFGFIHTGDRVCRTSLLEFGGRGSSRQYGWFLQRPQHYGGLLPLHVTGPGKYSIDALLGIVGS